MKSLFLFIVIFLIVGCKKDICQPLDETQPMYGRVEKCKPQQLADEKFIKAIEEQYGSRQDAVNSMLRFAWKHFMEGDLDNSMKRFNQAWLLDSLNADVYKGFGNIMMDKGMDKESIRYFDRYLELDSTNVEVWRLSALAYIDIYDDSTNKNGEYLDQAIVRLKEAKGITQDDARIYGLLTKSYAYKNEIDSARKYLKITEQMNPDIISKEIKEYILR